MVLFNDTFTNFNHPEVGIAATEVLEAAGARVQLVPHVCCGRPLISQGLLDDARALAELNTAALFDAASRGERIVFLEPSCLSAVREDGPALLRGDAQRRARFVADACVLFEDHIEREWQNGAIALDLKKGPATVLLHGHCHQKAMGLLPPARALLSRIPSSTVIDLDAGCCGMAGSFGYAREHYDVSRQIGERKLLPAARAMTADAVLVASGTSCREQVAHFTGVKAVHPAALLRSLISAVIAFVALGLVGCSSRSAPSGVDRLHPCQIAEGPPDAYCGQLTVFENRAAAAGRTIDLKIVVAPALRRDVRPDPLFIFEGGPGGGAATLAQYRVPMFRRFQVDRDIVLIDQRGTGASRPLDCAPENPDDDDLSSVDEYPVDRFRRCLAKLDADPTLYTTSIAMDDIDQVRRYLGYGAINLWGGSYGTRAALVYLKRHEESVRSVVLDGVAPPDMRLPLFMARDSQRALDRLIDSCAGDQSCARQFPGLGETVNTLWKQLAARPRIPLVHPRTGRPITLAMSRRLVASIVFQSLYAPELAALLPRLLTDAAEGRFQGLLALAFTRDLPKGAMSEGMFLSVVCSEDIPRITAEDIARETAGRFIGAAMFDTQVKPCEFWPRGAVPDDYYAPVASAKPVLIFSGADDPVTPPSWGDHVAQQLPHARHFIVPGAGHITLMRGCVPQLVARFLETAQADGLDGACLESLRRPPFFTTYTGP